MLRPASFPNKTGYLLRPYFPGCFFLVNLQDLYESSERLLKGPTATEVIWRKRLIFFWGGWVGLGDGLRGREILSVTYVFSDQTSANIWKIIRVSKWLVATILSHLGHLEGEQPQLGGILTMVIKHLLPVMILQVYRP